MTYQNLCEKGRKPMKKDSALSGLLVFRKSPKTTWKYHILGKLRFRVVFLNKGGGWLKVFCIKDFNCCILKESKHCCTCCKISNQLQCGSTALLGWKRSNVIQSLHAHPLTWLRRPTRPWKADPLDEVKAFHCCFLNWRDHLEQSAIKKRTWLYTQPFSSFSSLPLLPPAIS